MPVEVEHPMQGVSQPYTPSYRGILMPGESGDGHISLANLRMIVKSGQAVRGIMRSDGGILVLFDGGGAYTALGFESELGIQQLAEFASETLAGPPSHWRRYLQACLTQSWPMDTHLKLPAPYRER